MGVLRANAIQRRLYHLCLSALLVYPSISDADVTHRPKWTDVHDPVHKGGQHFLVRIHLLDRLVILCSLAKDPAICG